MKRFVFALLLSLPGLNGHAEVEGVKQIVLLGDSTTIGSIPRAIRPEGPHLEDVIRTQLAIQKDLPACRVINLGEDGETLRRLLDEGRYEKAVAPLQGVDYIFIRYGLNDLNKRENFFENFPKDFHELIARLRKDHPQAKIIPMTLIPYLPDEEKAEQINALIKQVAAEEKVDVFDIYSATNAEWKKDPHMMTYRRLPLDKIPEGYREFVKHFVFRDQMIVVMDNELDAIFGDVPGWHDDKHPNFAYYQLIGRETAKYLEPLLRASKKRYEHSSPSL